MVNIYNFEIKYICSRNRDMQDYIHSCHKKSERRSAYLEQSTVNLVNFAKIIVNTASVYTQLKQNRNQKDDQASPYNKTEVDKSIEKNASKNIEQNASKTIEQNASKTIERTNSMFKYFLNNLIQEENPMTTMLGKIIPRNMMMGTEQLSQVSFPTEIEVSKHFLVGIAQPFLTNKANQNDLKIEPTIVHSNQATRTGHSDWE